MMNSWLLLIKYMNHVCNCEGVSFIGTPERCRLDPDLFTEEERKILFLLDSLQSLPVPEQLTELTKHLELLPVVPDRFCVLCTDRRTGKKGDFAFHSSKPFEAISPVFEDLDDLHGWLKKYNLCEGEPVNSDWDVFALKATAE